MTKQEMFNKVWEYFIVNKNPESTTSGWFCKYRGDNGCKCAIGIFIPDEVYEDGMEGNTVAELIEKYPKLIPLLDITDSNGKLDKIQFLWAIQRTHDFATQDHEIKRKSFHENMKSRLKTAAEEFGLQVPV